jgi:hypothetical protein
MSNSTFTDDPTKVPKFKVSLRSTTGKFLVVFDVTPTVAESRTSQYDKLTVTHMPGSMLVYKNTESRTFTLSDAKLISRTPAEARKNMVRLNILRAWQMPYFGTDSKTTNALAAQIASGNPNIDKYTIPEGASQTLGKQLSNAKMSFLNFLGAPPDVLFLSAYAGRDTSGAYEGNINDVTVVMTSFEFSYPADVDYIPVSGIGGQSDDMLQGSPFPTIISLSMQLTEIHSPNELSKFSIDDYRKGSLPRF